MKNKVLAIVLAVIIPLNALADTKTVIKGKLVGLGMSSELSNYIGNLLADGNVSVDNADYIKWRNAAGTADINALRVNASDDTVLNADSGDTVNLQIAADAQRIITFGAASDTALNLTFGDATASQELSILGTTADAADTQIIRINAGGAASATRGSFANFEGADVGGADLGRLQLGSGGGEVQLSVGGTNKLRIGTNAYIPAAAGSFLVGASSAHADLTADTTATPLNYTFGASATQSQEAWVEGSAGTAPVQLFAFKSRAVDGSGDTIVTSGDDALRITAYGADGVDFEPLASILMESANTPGSNDMPGAIVFQTTADGAATLTTALTIEHDQDLLMTGDLYLADGQNLAFTGASGANTACDTTCTGGCVAGWDTGTSVFVACTNAIADTCLCTK